MYKKLTNCSYCNIDFTIEIDTANHVRWCSKNPNRKLFKKYLPKKCIRCKIEFIHSINKCCSVKCSKIMSDDSKKVMSTKRRKYLQDNPEKHPWKNKDKFNSAPCQIVKEYLNFKNIAFVEEWKPLNDRFFSIDIAFPDIKLGIEINGNQHYNRDGSLKKYYQDRHDDIIKSGWTLIELHYKIAWDLKQIDHILENREQPDYSEYIKQQKEIECRKEKSKPLARGVKYSKNISDKWELHKEIVRNCDIDFSKFGWGVKLSKILKITPQKSTLWMKRYFPEIYETTCFKVNRKTKVE